ncbi:MAG TPA: MmgE/PrpD family protein [Ramlibacter sp.]|nr:MmgE/PrpD family protein [Ramlibacter sp.]
MTETSSVTRAVARYAVAPHRFPDLARQRARDAIADCIGCTLAGSREPLAAPLLSVLPSLGEASPEAPSVLVGTGRFAAPADAALVNGTLAHALDFDDTNHPAYAHPSAVLVPAMLALAPLVQATGSALVDAYIVGFELFGKLGRALNIQHYERGWHTTGSFGALAAAAAAGRLIGLDLHRMTMALGIAASSASGLRASFGSMTKPLHAGQAARNGVLAALLARDGFTASEVALEHRYGYLDVFNAGIARDPAPLLALGEALEILTEHGLALKPYAACGATHPGIEAAELLHGELGGRAIRAVRAGVCRMAFQPLIHLMPESALEGKFSLHFCVAAALLWGPVTLATFSEERVRDPALRALIPRIRMELDERWADDGEFATEIAVETEDGARLTRFVPLAQGKPARWFTPDRLRAKFLDCARRAAAPAAGEAAWTAASDLDSGRGARDLLRALAAIRGDQAALAA